MTLKVKQNIWVLLTLIVMVSVYNAFIYTSKESEQPIVLSESALKGQLLWQKNNCWSCHQLYGLGGYLGPDLTNIYSSPNKGSDYIKAFLNSGIKSMPKFNFSAAEKNQLVDFLQQVDSTGYYPNKAAKKQLNGWITLQTKDEK